MKRNFRLVVLFSAVLLIAFSACRQTPFEGAAPKNGLTDVLLSFDGGDYKSVYWPGARNITVDPVSSKKGAVSIKVLVSDKELKVKINKHEVMPSEGNALEFIQKVKLTRGVNMIPISIFRNENETGENFTVQIQKKVPDGVLRLTHLRYEYNGVKSDDLADEFSFEGSWERKFVKARTVKLEVGSPDLENQTVVTGSGKELTPEPLPVPPPPVPPDYRVYTFEMESADDTFITIRTIDTAKGREKSFTMKFGLMDETEASSTKIKSVKAITETGSILDFSKLDMYGLKPYIKGEVAIGGSSRKQKVEISNIFKLKDIVTAPIDGSKLTIVVEPEQPGATVKLIAKWDEVDHDQSKYRLSKKMGWNTSDISTNIDRFGTGSNFQVILGPDTDTEFKIQPFNVGKISLLVEVTSPDGKKKKFHELKYGFISLFAQFFDLSLTKAVVPVSTMGDNGVVYALMKKDGADNRFQVFVPKHAKSARIVADDSIQINWATGYRKSDDDIWDSRYYIKIDDGDYSRIHHTKSNGGDLANFKEIRLSDSIDREEHKVSIVTYQDGFLKDGDFVDEYGQKSGVKKIQKDFVLEFIREDKETAPALTVVKFEGTPNPAPVDPNKGYINGKVYPVMSFRPAVSDYKVPLVKNGVNYKLLMRKTDPEAKIFIDGTEVTTTILFPQPVFSSAGNFPAPTLIETGSTNVNVQFFEYNLNSVPGKYIDGGNLKNVTMQVIVKKGEAFRQYNLELLPVDPDNNEVEVSVLTENGGSYREGTKVLYKEHNGTEELILKNDPNTGEKILDEAASGYQELGVTDANGKIKTKGKLKAGKYYDLYAVGDYEKADSIIENYYIKGLPNTSSTNLPEERIVIIQQPLLQSGGSDGASPNGVVRRSAPVILKKSGNGVYFYAREFSKSSSGGGGLGGGAPVSKNFTPTNLSYGNAHLMLNGDSNYTDMVLWFDIKGKGLKNAVEPVAFGGHGACVCIDSLSHTFSSYTIGFNDHDEEGKVSMTEGAVKQIERFSYDFPSGTFEFIIVAYDVAGNRLQRHQFVSIESAKKMNGVPIGDTKQLKILDFGVRLFRFPIRFGLFEHASNLEKLFGMPYTEYVSSSGITQKFSTSFVAVADCILYDGKNIVPSSGFDLYRRCVEDGGEFQRVTSVINTRRMARFSCIDTDSAMEQGKTYQYKVIAFTDEGHALESDYISELKIPPAFLYHLDSISVEGQSGKDKNGEPLEGRTVKYTYDTEKNDTEIPVLTLKKYPKHTAEEDKTKLEIEYTAKISNPALCNKDMADELSFGLTIHKRNADIVYGSKGVIKFTDEGEELYLFSPARNRYLSLDELIKLGDIPSTESFETLLKFDKEKGLLTFTKNYMAIDHLNWNFSAFRGEPLKYEAGNTYYWDVGTWRNFPIGGTMNPVSFIKTFDAIKKGTQNEKYTDDDGENVSAGMYIVLGNSWNAGQNAYNGRCRFTVVEEK